MAPPTRLPDERLDALYVGEGFGGDSTMRAKVIRELIDEIRTLRRDARPPTSQEATQASSSRS